MEIDFILEILSLFLPLITLVIGGIALIIKAIKIKSTKNAVNLFEDNETEDRAIEKKEKPKKRFHISRYIIILIIFIFIFYNIDIGFTIVAAVVWGIINIIPILLYVHMANLIEQRKGQDIRNMTLFDNDSSKEDKK